MKQFGEFLKKHLVIIICVIVAVAALGAGIWFLVKPEQPAAPDTNTTQPTESTGDLELDADIGFGDVDMGSGIVNIPGDSNSSGSITPIKPNDKDESTEGSGNDGSSTEGGNNESGTIDMSGSVVENPFK